MSDHTDLNTQILWPRWAHGCQRQHHSYVLRAHSMHCLSLVILLPRWDTCCQRPPTLPKSLQDKNKEAQQDTMGRGYREGGGGGGKGNAEERKSYKLPSPTQKPHLELNPRGWLVDNSLHVCRVFGSLSACVLHPTPLQLTPPAGGILKTSLENISRRENISICEADCWLLFWFCFVLVVVVVIFWGRGDYSLSFDF